MTFSKSLLKIGTDRSVHADVFTSIHSHASGNREAGPLFQRFQQASQTIFVTGIAAAALGGSILLAQASSGRGNVPAGVPMKTTYDVSSLKFTPQEKKNIDLAVGYYRDCVQSHHPELAFNFLAKDEINHNPNDPSTPQGLMAMLSSRFPKPEPLHKEIDPLTNLLIAKDDMVLLMYDQPEKDPKDPSKTYTYSRVEMVRIANGKIQEHWDVGDRRENSQSWKLEWCSKTGRKDCPKP